MKNKPQITTILLLLLSISTYISAHTEIHNNHLYFYGVNAAVSVKQHCISKGQPYKGITISYHKKQLRFTDKKYDDVGNYTDMVVQAGRHHTKYVADCFNSWASQYNNTYEAKPLNLNFALRLHLSIYDPTSSEQTKATFDDIIVAQGHDLDLNNDWWFGGKSCNYVKEFHVKCKSNEGTYWCFHRGKNKASDKESLVGLPFFREDVVEIYKGSCL